MASSSENSTGGDDHQQALQTEEILIQNGQPVAKLLPNHPLKSFSLGERIKGGRSILKLANLASPDEIDLLRNASSSAATEKRRQLVGDKNNGIVLEQGIQGKAFVRLLTQATAKRENAPQDALPEPASAILEKILGRALVFLDRKACPSIKTVLFGGDSMAELFRNDQLDYSIREPAINVYEAPDGQFIMHKDHHALSIVIPLSCSQTDFEGGGTAFWSQSHPVEGMDGPSIILKPRPGTAMLWGGRVSHKGVRITSGTRVVAVASFSGPNSPNEDVRERLSAGLGVRTILSAR